MNKQLCIIAMGVASLFAAGLLQAALPDAIKAKHPGEILEGRISLKAPELAESGNLVPVAIRKIDLPAHTSVREIAFYSANNTQCPIATYKLSPVTYSEGIGAHIKLAQTTSLYAVATLDNGQVLSGERKVKVTIGGCGGGGKLPDYSQMEFCKQRK